MTKVDGIAIQHVWSYVFMILVPLGVLDIVQNLSLIGAAGISVKTCKSSVIVVSAQVCSSTQNSGFAILGGKSLKVQCCCRMKLWIKLKYPWYSFVYLDWKKVFALVQDITIIYWWKFVVLTFFLQAWILLKSLFKHRRDIKKGFFLTDYGYSRH
jgi:hypothetical protein